LRYRYRTVPTVGGPVLLEPLCEPSWLHLAGQW